MEGILECDSYFRGAIYNNLENGLDLTHRRQAPPKCLSAHSDCLRCHRSSGDEKAHPGLGLPKGFRRRVEFPPCFALTARRRNPIQISRANGLKQLDLVVVRQRKPRLVLWLGRGLADAAAVALLLMGLMIPAIFIYWFVAKKSRLNAG
jgi:hypothetical protein